MAINEAHKRGIPVVAIVDTNADPDVITVPIPGNDDAIRAVSLITAALSDVISEARRQSPLRETTEEGEAVTYSTETGVEAEAEGGGPGAKEARAPQARAQPGGNRRRVEEGKRTGAGRPTGWGRG